MKNLFATVLTETAPTSNYRGESVANRTVIQKIPIDGREFPIVSAESIRSTLREHLATLGHPVNRERVHDVNQPTVKFRELHNPEKYADDFLFGYMVVSNSKPNKKKRKEEKEADEVDMEEEADKKVVRRSSVFQMNLALGLSPYESATTFHQSPSTATDDGRNNKSSVLLHREVVHTAFQFPFALALDDCREGKGPAWTRGLLQAIGELGGVAGNHARSFFEMSPRSIVVRVTSSLVAGYPTYCFNTAGEFTALGRLNDKDLPPSEFWIGGEVARNLLADRKNELTKQGVKFFDNPQRLLAELGSKVFP